MFKSQPAGLNTLSAAGDPPCYSRLKETAHASPHSNQLIIRSHRRLKSSNPFRRIGLCLLPPPV
ncbi:hypothetical protein E2C01_070365 [Portunus trituberculatus]|uniref:Uncharacterized protein n=1 Tax=Portunus trituberculatus TaxID=210409 RepID=A0A5B7I579_PORTR|nr:hypothetical protein [Portunus trituberculatus]